MSVADQIILSFLTTVVIVATVVTLMAMRRGMHHWFTAKLLTAGGRLPRPSPLAPRPLHLLLCICDHYEPGHGNVTRGIAVQRVQRWVTEYPKLFDRFRDADGRPP